MYIVYKSLLMWKAVPGLVLLPFSFRGTPCSFRRSSYSLALDSFDIHKIHTSLILSQLGLCQVSHLKGYG